MWKIKKCRFLFAVFFKLHTNFSDLINSDDFIEKIISKAIRLYSFFIFFYLNLVKKEIISSEKMRNSGNYIYDYTHSFFGNGF